MTPRKTILISGLFSLTLASVFLWLSYASPWLGITFSAKHQLNGLLIDSISMHGPSHSILTPGMHVTEIGNSKQSILLHSGMLIPEPSDTDSFESYNVFTEENKQLFTILSSESVWLKDHNKQIYHIKPDAYRPLNSIGIGHLSVLILAVLAFVFHIMLATFKKNQTIIKALSVSAFSFCLYIIIGQTTFFRELVINPAVFQYTHPLQMISALFYAYFLMGLLLFYPIQLASKKAIIVITVLPILFWLNMITQTIEVAKNSYLIHFNILYSLSLIFAALQWYKARGKAIEMAQFKWLFLAMQTGTGMIIAFNILPQSLGHEPYIGISLTLFFSYLIFIGIAIGTYRYKLFNIDKWWFSIWTWFFAGLLILILDISFIYLFHLEQKTSAIISMIIIAWIYFPLRQQLWKTLSHAPDTTISSYLPDIVVSISSIKNKSELNSALMQTLKDIFKAQNMCESYEETPAPQILQSGLTLQLPGITQQSSLIFNFADNGSRLFNYDDINLATGIAELYKYRYDSFDHTDLATNKERERIMGDLHDELGPKLMTLIHSLKKPSLVELATDSMSTLRDIVYSIQHEQSMTLDEVLASQRQLLSERANEKNRNIIWKIEDNLSATELKPDAVLHIKRMLNELISNELRHGSASNITLSAYCHKDFLTIKFCTDNSDSDIREWKKGTGLNNLKRRSKALHGHISWYSHVSDNCNNICFKLSFPSKQDPEL
ncbi:MAG: hypothetical protein OEY36_10140 [Gammaproteobacteria bacterium]|nr:hypothetical protein [Gammaproteobacteria bacterium]